jgi:hypothetical protein
MFDGMFIAGIHTPNGESTYHCEMKYWDLFKVKEIDNAPEWDGYSPEEGLERLQSLPTDKEQEDFKLNFIQNYFQNIASKEIVRCPLCGGRGTVDANVYKYGIDGITSGSYVICRTCHGRGYVEFNTKGDIYNG